MQCATCASRCPSLPHNTFNIRKLMRMMQLGMIDEIIRDGSLWNCALCLECCQYCPLGIKTSSIITALRKLAAQNGFMPKPAIYFTRNTLKHGRPLALPAEEMTSWSQGLSLPREGERIFYAGIYPIMDHAELMLRMSLKMPEGQFQFLSRILIVLQRLGLDGLALKLGQKGEPGTVYRSSLVNAVKVLSRLKVDVAYLREEEPWCGIELHTYGLMDDFARHAAKVTRKLRDSGVKEIITTDILSAIAFKNFYPEVIDSFDIRVKHFTTIVAEKLKTAKLPLKIPNTFVVFSDPCYLARYMGVTEEPRKIIESIKGARLREAESNKMATKCDGGGGLEIISPGLAIEMAKVRAKELLETGAETIVTSCPVCVMMLQLGLEQIGSKVEVLNIEDLLIKALG